MYVLLEQLVEQVSGPNNAVVKRVGQVSDEHKRYFLGEINAPVRILRGEKCIILEVRVCGFDGVDELPPEDHVGPLVRRYHVIISTRTRMCIRHTMIVASIRLGNLKICIVGLVKLAQGARLSIPNQRSLVVLPFAEPRHTIP